ncbi:metallophosphoesterase [Amaricoccus macauensis]|uniref:metallophosphoesterase n=1 Tax=Amaricoccus macauensis TaxID=57001 RepID=UPI003C7AC6A5
MLKFVVISDLHLVPRGALSLGIDTAERLEKAIEHVNTHHSDAAFCIFAGDLTDDGDRPSYERLSRKLAHIAMPFYLTLGNHDDRPTFLEVFGPGLAAPTGCIDDLIDAEGYRVIILDTLHEGTDGGVITPEQLGWLEERLGEAKGRPVIVVLHHSICEMGVPTDSISMENPGPFLAALRAHGDVRQVISGHVHMSSSGVAGGVPFTTIGGNHFCLFPQLGGPEVRMPRYDGPGQIGVVLAWPDRVVVHQENFFDRHILQEDNAPGGST